MSEPVRAFFSAWSIADRPQRHAAISAAMDATFSYADPRTPDPLSDLDALTDYVGMFIEMAPGAVAEVASLDTQHGMTRATISFRMADGMTQTGQYFVEHSAAGRISRMTGFVGTGAPA